MYYYFSDKADLYSEVVEQWTIAMLKDWQFDFSVKTPADFWLEWKRLYLTAFEHYEKHPESEPFLRQFLRFVSSGTAPEIVRKHVVRIRDFNLRCLTLGKEIGAIRKDRIDAVRLRFLRTILRTTAPIETTAQGPYLCVKSFRSATIATSSSYSTSLTSEHVRPLPWRSSDQITWYLAI